MKQAKTVSVSIRLDPSLAERAQRLADLDRRSLSSVLTLAIECGFDEVERRMVPFIKTEEGDK